MPWFDDINPAAPTDVEFVSEGAMRFRELKRALIERFATAYRGFPDDMPEREGEALLFPIASVLVGTEAQRPAAPYREGTVWFATDTGRIWYGNRSGAWRFVPGTGEGSGGGGLQGAPFVRGVTLADRAFISSDPQFVKLFTSDISLSLDIRSIRMRVFPHSLAWNGQIAHGLGSFVVYNIAGDVRRIILTGIRSQITNGEREYLAILHMDPPDIEAGLFEFELDWTYWDNVASSGEQSGTDNPADYEYDEYY